MEAGEENNGNINLKRQRAPLSDSEDNLSSSSEVKDGQKRRRLEASGRENRSPKPSTSGRLAEMETKPDTPMIPSIRSRVQQLTQRRDGGALLPQRCLSDPGADSPSVFHEKGLGQHLLGEGEFYQRMERFNVPVFQASPAPTPSPPKSCPRPSNLVSGIQQKLQCTTTPSSQQAFRMREERKQELSRLQPISENAWLKRSSSDPLLNEAEGDVEVKDGSFTEVLASSAAKQSSDGRGRNAPCDSETSAASVELDNSSKGRMQIEWKEPKSHQDEEIKEDKASVGSEEKQLMSQQSQTQTVLTLSFSEDQSFCRSLYVDNQNVSELPTSDEHSFLESTHPEVSNIMEIGVVCEETEPDTSSFEDANEAGGRSYSEEDIEPSTDEELRLWRYPQDRMCKEEEALITGEQEKDVGAKEEKGDLEFSRLEEEKIGSVTDGCEPPDIHDGDVSVETACCFQMQEDENPKSDDTLEHENLLEDSKKDNCTSNTDEDSKDSWKDDRALTSGVDIKIKEDQKATEGCQHEDDIHQQLREILTVDIEEDVELGAERNGPNSSVNRAEGFPSSDAAFALNQKQTESTEVETNIEGDGASPIEGDGARPKEEIQVKSSDTDGNVGVSCSTGEVEQDTLGVKQCVLEGLAEGGESSKKVSFVLEPELIDDSTLSEINTSMESRTGTQSSDAELSSHNETAEIIDQMFDEVLEYAGRMEEERVDHEEDTEGHDSGIGACTGDKDKMDTEFEKEKSEEEEEAKEKQCDENNGDELLTFPPSGILSPLSKSVEAVVTPLRLAVNQEFNPPSLLLTPEETSTPPAESAPLYSVDAYRTQRQSKKPTTQSVTPAAQRQAPQKSQPQPSVNIKEKIIALSEEAGKLQTVINQTLQALGCCTDENHGRGSLEEAEAEKLLLVSCEKRSALLAEVTRLREERSSESGEATEDYVPQQPCRGTVSISNIQLPLKVEFVCSSHNRSGRPSHYFFILIRYGPCNIVATPLATAADAQNGDTISFPTSVTLKDIRSSFEIDVEVYSLSHNSGGYCSMDRTTTKSRVTPRKLLNTITRSSNSLTPATLPALITRRSSNFCLVGSHKITLASLGSSKFPLDKMKLEGKIRRLLGDEFQEKVPFLSPLEGNVYLRLDSQSHSNVQQQGFLTMFELISGFGVWHRRYLVLEACILYYWNHPNDRETKAAEGSISLSSSHSQCVRPVERDVCARPFTFELVSNVPQQEEQDVSAKCWFSADTKQERLDWMESLNQALLDFHTWNRASAAQTESRQSNASSSGNLRESIL